MTGRVISFNATKGFGYLKPDDGSEDVFVHSNVVQARGGVLPVGRTVSFNVVVGNRVRQAENVRLL